MIKSVTHDWSDKYASKILSRLRDAAQPTTTLVVMDFIPDYMSRDSGAVADIPGAAKPQAPEPLLPYPDSAAGVIYSLDLCVRTVLYNPRGPVAHVPSSHADDEHCELPRAHARALHRAFKGRGLEA